MSAGGQSSDSEISFSVPPSASGSGGRPSGDQTGGTPGEEAIMRPPSPSHEETEHIAGLSTSASLSTQTLFSTVETSSQTLGFCVSSFSSKTCLELLAANKLTDEQISYEHNYLRSLSHLGPVYRVKSEGGPLNKAEVLFSSKSVKCELAGSAVKELDLVMNSHNSIITSCENSLKEYQLTMSSFMSSVETAQGMLTELLDASHRPPAAPTTSSRDADESVRSASSSGSDTISRQFDEILGKLAPAIPTGNINPINPVCGGVDLNFSQFSVGDVLAQLPATESSSCGRRVGYWGDRPYGYGKVRHRARTLPESPVLDAIFTGLGGLDQTFTRDNFSVMVTDYPDGGAFIPAHQDNEREIEGSSTIYTVSFGESRVLRMVNRDGVLREEDHTLSHGTVFAMAVSEQGSWSHELLQDRECKGRRVSLTFRHIITPSEREPVPRIEQPPVPQPLWAKGDKNRIFFLTDSILSSTPEHVFGKIPNHRCVKTKNYFLTDVPNYEPQFKYSRFVIISAGINDLSVRKDGKPSVDAHGLADLVVRRLKECCERNPETTFVFNSLLHTQHAWLNREVDSFNQIMSDVCRTVKNLEFLDTHAALVWNPMSKRVDRILDQSDRRGTHLTLSAKMLLGDELVTALKYLDLESQGRAQNFRMGGWFWPLRKGFRWVRYNNK